MIVWCVLQMAQEEGGDDDDDNYKYTHQHKQRRLWQCFPSSHPRVVLTLVLCTISVCLS